MNDQKNVDESELENQDSYEYPRLRIRWTFRSEASNLGFSGKFIYRCRWILRHEFNDVAIYLKRLEDPPSYYEENYEEKIMKALEDFDIIQKTVMMSILEIAKRRLESGVEKTRKSMFGVIEYTVYDFATGKEFNEELSVKSPSLLALWRKLFRKM